MSMTKLSLLFLGLVGAVLSLAFGLGMFLDAVADAGRLRDPAMQAFLGLIALHISFIAAWHWCRGRYREGSDGDGPSVASALWVAAPWYLWFLAPCGASANGTWQGDLALQAFSATGFTGGVLQQVIGGFLVTAKIGLFLLHPVAVVIGVVTVFTAVPSGSWGFVPAWLEQRLAQATALQSTRELLARFRVRSKALQD